MTVLSLTLESPYLGKTVFILNQGPDLITVMTLMFTIGISIHAKMFFIRKQVVKMYVPWPTGKHELISTHRNKWKCMGSYPALWLLMTWCWNTRALIPTALVKYLLYRINSIQEYYIYSQYNKKVKSHFANTASIVSGLNREVCLHLPKS